MAWIKSSHSETKYCVEVCLRPDGVVAVRQSRDPKGAVLLYTTEEWNAFVLGAKGGEFDLAAP